MTYDPDANNVACHWVSCEICDNEIVMVNGHGSYFSLKVHEVYLQDGKFKVNDEVRKMLCRNCLGKLTVVN